MSTHEQISGFGEVIDLDGGSVLLRGHLDTIREGGIRPIRIPAGAWPQFPPHGENLRAVSMQASGVRILFDTESTTISLRARCTRFQLEDFLGARNAFVAEVSGTQVGQVESPVDATIKVSLAGDSSSVTGNGQPSDIVFDGLPAHQKTVTVWLPQGMIVDLFSITGDAPITAARPESRPVWLHHGSSISHCVETPLPTGVWPVIAARTAGLDVINLGFGGQCMLDPFVADAIAATPADVISLKVGVNIVGARSMDQRTFTPALHGFLDRVRAGHPDTPIILASSILWPGSEDTPGPSDVEFLDNGGLRCFTAGAKNDVDKGALSMRRSRHDVAYVAQMRAAAGENIHYLDGLSLYGPQDTERYTLPDSLHPDADLYAEIGRRFAHLVFGDTGLTPRSSLGRLSEAGAPR